MATDRRLTPAEQKKVAALLGIPPDEQGESFKDLIDEIEGLASLYLQTKAESKAKGTAAKRRHAVESFRAALRTISKEEPTINFMFSGTTEFEHLRLSVKALLPLCELELEKRLPRGKERDGRVEICKKMALIYAETTGKIPGHSAYETSIFDRLAALVFGNDPGLADVIKTALKQGYTVESRPTVPPRGVRRKGGIER